MRRVSVTLVIAALLFAPDVVAQPASNHDEAVKLFLEGKKHRDEEHCELAIAPLEASIAKEPSIGAHYNLGVCYEKINKRKSLDNYNAALKIAKDKRDDREREIRAQLSDFLDRTPYIRLGLPQPVPADMKITVDGDVVPPQHLVESETIWFAPSDVPKASYTVVVSAPGYENKTMTVKRGALATIVLTKVVTDQPRTEEGGFRWWHGVGIGGIVVGAVGVAYALASYLAYSHDKDQLDGNFELLNGKAADAARATGGDPDNPCPPPPATQICRDRATAKQAYNDNEAMAKRNEPVWIGVGVAGVLFIGAGTLFLIGGSSLFAPSKESKAEVHFVPLFGTREGGFALRGAF